MRCKDEYSSLPLLLSLFLLPLTIMSTSPTFAQQSPQASAVVPIVNVSSIAVKETDDVARVRLVLTEMITEPCAVTVTTSDGGAISGQDYYGRSQSIEFTPGTQFKEFAVGIIPDTESELLESFTVSVSDADACVRPGSDGTVTIVDDNGSVTDPVLSISSATVFEGQSSYVTFTMQLSHQPTEDVVVTLDSRPVSADDETDYFETALGISFRRFVREFRFSERDWNRPLEVSFVIYNDQNFEPEERFEVVVSDIENAIYPADSRPVEVVILDDDDPALSSVMRFDGLTTRVFESSGTAPVTLHLSRPSNTVCTGTISTMPAPEQGASEFTDYTPQDVQLTFAPGETEKVIDIAINQDAESERAPESLLVVLDEVSGSCIKGSDSQTVTIYDDDVTGSELPTVLISNVTVTEGIDSEAKVDVMIPRPLSSDVEIFIISYEGTAKTTLDFDGNTQGVTMAAGETRTTASIAIRDDEEYEPIEFFTVLNPSRGDFRGNSFVRIKDNDYAIPSDQRPLPVVSLAVSDRIEGLELPSSVELTKPFFNGAVTAELTTEGITATEGDDYVGGPQTVTIMPGARFGYAEWMLVDDDEVEEDETFRITIASADNAIINDQESSGIATILDLDNGPGYLQIDIGDATVTEGDNPFAIVEASLNQAADRELRFFGSLTPGTAEADTDYDARGFELIFSPGEVKKSIRIAIVDDMEAEAQEEFTVGVQTQSGGVRIGRRGRVVINDDDDDDDDDDNDGPSVVATVGTTFVTEGVDSEATVEVALSRASNELITVEVASRQFTATPGSDYTPGSYELRFEPGETLKSASWAIVDDAETETDESFLITIVGVTNAIPDEEDGTVVIKDNDGEPSDVVISVSDVTVTEGVDSAALVFFTLNEPLTEEFRVSIEALPGTAQPTSDYVDTDGGVLIFFEPGETRQSIGIPIVDDDLSEPQEAFNVIANGPNGDTAGTVTIIDDDGAGGAPVVATIGSTMVIEGTDSEATVEVALSRASTEQVTVEVASRQITAISGPDYAGRNYVVNFEPGETSKTVSWAIVDDSEIERDETFATTIVNAVNAERGSGGVVTIKDNDGDDPDGVIINVADVTVTEGTDPTALVFFSLNQPLTEELRVSIEANPGTAQPTTDYVDQDGGALIFFEPGETSTSIGIPIVDDEISEPQETFTVLVNGTSGDVEIGTAGTVTINDDDGDSGLQVIATIGSTIVTEGTDSEATVEVALSRASTQSVTVEVASRQISAISGPDYAGRNYVVTFEPGETSETVSWAIVDDSELEDDETFATTIVSATNAERGTGGVVTIKDNDGDGSGRPILSIGDATVTEGIDQQAEVTLELSESGTEDIRVEVASRQRTAVSGREDDYLGRNYTVTFAPGETTKTVSWGIVDDANAEPTETFAVVFIASNLAERGNAGVVTIEDNDGGDSGRPILNIGDAAVREGDDQEAEVELELSQPSSEEISVEVASRQRTAVSGPGNDYLGRNYVVTFAPGETMKTVSWGIVDDALTESSETFVVVFVASNSAKPGTEGTVTISDND